MTRTLTRPQLYALLSAFASGVAFCNVITAFVDSSSMTLIHAFICWHFGYSAKQHLQDQ